MIYLKVDEAYAFDFLAIQMVKKSQEIQEIIIDISRQIGQNLTDEILASKEFMDMVSINENVFDCVNQAKCNKITAKEFDEANMRRHTAKRALQVRFFSTELTEKKM